LPRLRAGRAGSRLHRADTSSGRAGVKRCAGALRVSELGESSQQLGVGRTRRLTTDGTMGSCQHPVESSPDSLPNNRADCLLHCSPDCPPDYPPGDCLDNLLNSLPNCCPGNLPRCLPDSRADNLPSGLPYSRPNRSPDSSPDGSDSCLPDGFPGNSPESSPNGRGDGIGEI